MTKDLGEVNNIILLTVDALRADHLSCYGYHRETSPVLDDLADEGIRFTKAISASSHTREAIPALLTGRYPDVFSDNGYRLAAESIATSLKNSKYKTGAFHSNPYVSRAYGFQTDFDIFDDDLHLSQHKILALVQRAFDKVRGRNYARAKTINKRSLNWIDSIESDQSFFLWNHYMDVHGPYEPPEDYQNQFHDEKVTKRQSQQLYKRTIREPKNISNSVTQKQINLYDGEINYVDTQLRTFFDALKTRELVDDSLIIITADHGDAFGEHGYFGHPRFLDDEVVHVPLLVLGPGIPKMTVDIPVSTLDIVPTILNLTGENSTELPGISLYEIWNKPKNHQERSVISQARGEQNEKMLRRFSIRNMKETVHLTANMETDELNFREGSNSNTKLHNRLYRHAKNRMSKAQPKTQPKEGSTSEIESRLEALGYKE